MEMMYWYNLLTMEEEDVSAPISDAQAIEILSGHRDSDRFIEEYRRHAMQTDVVIALIFTGEMFYREHRRGQPLLWGIPRQCNSTDRRQGVAPLPLAGAESARSRSRCPMFQGAHSHRPALPPPASVVG
jgi:hypothetical protein